ncbi:hypothetical protein HG536_0A02140 [Torulaspora globosa]|uniref:Bacterial surface antigen (D15) domain-containing protein n=1 Tax=Torulaspora globosa TaxID=48254 RepID=A0A7G3ZA61_9SACH|nr:uncharacterized protein HG536_0A02140 [Torulaspora globosa]QLL30397.1 hypothetical protein HG536_0A02140 [Torulaspora globosa]
MDEFEKSSIEGRVIELADSSRREVEQEANEAKAEQQRYIAELLKNSSKTPIVVSAVLTSDHQSIRPDVLQKYLDATILQASSFSQLCEQADLLNVKLIQHGMAENVSQSLDSRGILRLPVIKRHYPSLVYESQAISGELAVIDVISRLNILPIKRFTAKTGTNIGNGEGDGYLQFQLRNMFGGGEQLKLDITKGTKTHSSYLLDYGQPVTPWWMLNSMLFKNSRQFGNNNSIDMLIRGFRTSLRSGFQEAGAINHELFYEAEWRTSKLLSLHASDTLLFQAGDDIKSSLGHTLAVDRRNNPIAPTSGSFLKITNELALGKYWKSQVEFSQNNSWLKDDFIGSCCTFRSGYIANLNSSKKTVNTYDKFHNGGANDIRSFQIMGLGPKDLYDSIGGDAFISYGVSLFSRLPIKKWSHSNFRLHWFFNGGKLINHNNAPLKSVVTQLANQHSTSVGFGILLRHQVARFELNFTLPLTVHSGDAMRKGFQYGIGVSFL